MRKLLLLALLLLLSAAVFAGKEESIESLKARAATAQGKEQVKLCTDIAERQVKAAEQDYSAGKPEQAQAALNDVVTYGVEAADTASKTGKEMKHTEITLRKISARLEEIRKSLDVDDRPPVVDAINKLERARTELLNRMFKK